MKTLRTLIIAILLLFFLNTKLYPQSPKELFYTATEHYQNKRYNDAIKTVATIESNLGRSNAVLEYLKVKCYFELKEFDMAEKSLQAFFEYKAADYMVDEMLKYADNIRNEKITGKKTSLKNEQNTSLELHSKIQNEVFNKEISKIESKLAQNKASLKNNEVKRVNEAINTEKEEFEFALETNKIEYLEEFLVKHPKSTLKKEAELYIEKFNIKKLIVRNNNQLPFLKYHRNIEHLTIYYDCKLESFPEEILELKKLKFLIINPSLSNIGLPEEIDKLRNLEYLYLGGIDSLPTKFGNLTHLSEFTCGYGPKSIPKGFSNLINLRSLKISPKYHRNNIEEIYELPNLESLEIDATQIDDSIVNLKKLKKLSLYFTETLSSKIAELDSLEELHLNGSKIKYISGDFSKLKTLRKISIHKQLNISHYNYPLMDISSLLNAPSLDFIELGLNEKSYYKKELKYIKNNRPEINISIVDKRKGQQWHLDNILN
ncbi:CDC27 family protein [Mangrovimonas sp. DI 80]|uniref:CDC27 family protein n=1 Tax=Mangrovimonas sp. DI 80 TaxID=1779330 RepID=UPI0009779135|nr:CDC27 family protein [Mangrovimonas sp. DI 80]OMP29942.1 hypothetical protein BKM32_15170 [Mangrovimonas sp. DI 80]